MQLQDAVTVEITMAIDAKDNDKLRTLLAEAKTLELDNSKTRQAEGIVDRDRIVRETETKLKKAMDTFDLDALNDAMARAIELGIEGEVVERAKVMRTRLDEEKDMASSLNAAMKVRGCYSVFSYSSTALITCLASLHSKSLACVVHVVLSLTDHQGEVARPCTIGGQRVDPVGTGGW